MDELQARIGAMRITLPDARELTMSVSIGAAIFPRDGDSSESLLMAADSRMYQNKTHSRVYRARLASESLTTLSGPSSNPG
jgi:GGDEF domain-containing protein